MWAETARHRLSIDYRAAGGGLRADVRTLIFRRAEFPEVAESPLMQRNTIAHGSRHADRQFTTHCRHSETLARVAASCLPSSHSYDLQPTPALMEKPSRAAVDGLLDVASSTIAPPRTRVRVIRAIRVSSSACNSA